VAKLKTGTPWLQKLIGGLRGEHKQPDDEEPRTQQTTTTTAQTAAPSAGDDEAALEIEIENGALLQVWRHWKGEFVPPPVLSLTGDHNKNDLPLEGNQAIMRERLRLRSQLEQDAKKRMLQIEKLKVDEETGQEDALDAACQVYMSRYGMVAWVFIFPPCGEGTMHMDDVGKALTESGVISGIDSAAILRLTKKESAYFHLIPIACGTPAIEGKDGSIVEYFPHQIEREIKVDENGIADYRSQNYVQVIQKGDILCDILPPEEGTPGVRVDGSIIDPKKVHPAKVPMGKNTELTEDGLNLIASIDGHLLYSNNAYTIRPLLDIPGDVDYATGNIDYRGDVHIHGDVRENFFVRATGTITIDGTVEAANLEAGSDLIVSSGVLGDNRATIKSGGCIRVKYLESCAAYAGKGVYADCIVSAQVYSDDIISVTTGRGTIIGGTLTAARAIHAKIIGSQADMKTTLTLGECPYLREQIRLDQEDLKAIRKERKELDKSVDYMEEQQSMILDAMNEKLAKAHLRQNVLAMKENQILKHLEEQRSAQPDRTQCRLECDSIFPVTTLRIGEDIWRADQQERHCRLRYDEETGGIVKY
jgi:uncharacterized protein (DUF342 family)